MIVPAPEAAAWVDGRRVVVRDATVSAFDPGLQWGMGLFETLAVRGGQAVDLDRHLVRMEDGGRVLGVGLPAPAELRAVVAAAAAAADPSGFGWLKIVVTAGGHWVVSSGGMDPADEGRPSAAVILPWRRNPLDPLVRLKTLAYAANVVGLSEARRRGADEGLWRNVRGHLAEGCTSNLFVVAGRALFTPAERDGILPGVVREQVIAAARHLGLAVHEGRVRCTRLARASEAFLSSSLRGIRPLIRVDGQPVGRGIPGPVSHRVGEEVARLRGLGRLPGQGLDSPAPDHDL